jgi:hypothetical protein
MEETFFVKFCIWQKTDFYEQKKNIETFIIFAKVFDILAFFVSNALLCSSLAVGEGSFRFA